MSSPAVSTPPLFPVTPPVLVCSAFYDTQMFRLKAGERARWSHPRLKHAPPCMECVMRQHETHGEFGPRRKTTHRRATTGSVLELCAGHAQLWRDRDTVDAAGRRW